MTAALAIVSAEGGLPRYDRMCSAIAECVRVDEAKDIRDKAVALEAYYKQARNLEAEREAANVRLRAERRVGELLKELARAGSAAGGDTKSVSARATPIPPSPYASALAEHGMSRQTAHRYQALAEIPKAEFDLALSGPAKPTTAGVLKAREKVRNPAPAPRVSDEALWVWGRLRDLERDGYFDVNPAHLLGAMTDAMRADVRRLLPRSIEFLLALQDVADESA
jgi:hypothetical protein